MSTSNIFVLRDVIGTSKLLYTFPYLSKFMWYKYCSRLVIYVNTLFLTYKLPSCLMYQHQLVFKSLHVDYRIICTFVLKHLDIVRCMLLIFYYTLFTVSEVNIKTYIYLLYLLKYILVHIYTYVYKYIFVYLSHW